MKSGLNKVLSLLLTLVISIICSVIAIYLYVYAHPPNALGEGLAILFIGTFTFSVGLIGRFISYLQRSK